MNSKSHRVSSVKFRFNATTTTNKTHFHLLFEIFPASFSSDIKSYCYEDDNDNLMDVVREFVIAKRVAITQFHCFESCVCVFFIFFSHLDSHASSLSSINELWHVYTRNICIKNNFFLEFIQTCLCVHVIQSKQRIEMKRKTLRGKKMLGIWYDACSLFLCVSVAIPRQQ